MMPLLWKEGDTIRNKDTGKPYSVIHIYKSICTIVIDLEEKSMMPISLTLLERDYEKFVPDMDMERDIKSNGINHFTYNPIHI